MKNVLFFFSLLILGFLVQLLLPWWILAPAAAILAWVLRLTPRIAFVASLAAGILLWGGYAWYLDNGILSARLGGMMGGLPSFFIFLLTSLIGGLVAAMGGVTGSLGRQLSANSNQQNM